MIAELDQASSSSIIEQSVRQYLLLKLPDHSGVFLSNAIQQRLLPLLYTCRLQQIFGYIYIGVDMKKYILYVHGKWGRGSAVYGV